MSNAHSQIQVTPTPRYFDLQVNGYEGIDFNSPALTGEALELACQALRRDQVHGCLLTLITASLDQLVLTLSNVARLLEQSSAIRKVVRGIHLEGPFLNPEEGYRGMHSQPQLIPPSVDAAQELMDAASGWLKLVTLAPEQDAGGKVTRLLADSGICVSAGHTNASLDDLKVAIDCGLTVFTHVGNATPLLLPRHDNIIHRALSLRDQLWLCFIPDGIHVPYFALANYLRAASLDRSLFVSDAMSAAGLGPGTYAFGDQSVEVDIDLATWSSRRTHLMGSACPLPVAAGRAQAALSLSLQELETLTWRNPLAALGFSELE